MGGGLGGLLNSINHLCVRSSARRSQRVVWERKYTEVHTRSSALRTKDMTWLCLYLSGGFGGDDGEVTGGGDGLGGGGGGGGDGTSARRGNQCFAP